jgi:hypothetical protein
MNMYYIIIKKKKKKPAPMLKTLLALFIFLPHAPAGVAPYFLFIIFIFIYY